MEVHNLDQKSTRLTENVDFCYITIPGLEDDTFFALYIIYNIKIYIIYKYYIRSLVI